jgi:hypothetical protein
MPLEQADAMDIDVQMEECFKLDEDGLLAQQGHTSGEDEEDYKDGEMEVDGSDLEDDLRMVRMMTKLRKNTMVTCRVL